MKMTNKEIIDDIIKSIKEDPFIQTYLDCLCFSEDILQDLFDDGHIDEDQFEDIRQEVGDICFEMFK